MGKKPKSTGANVIDFSKWNDRPDWAKAGYSSNEERWAGWSQAQSDFMKRGS